MAFFSTYCGNKILDLLCRAGSLSVTTPYISLHTGDPGLTGANEVAGGSYARQSATFSAASGLSNATSADLTWSSMPSATITYVGIFDASTSGNFIGKISISSRTVAAGDTVKCTSGNLTLTLT